MFCALSGANNVAGILVSRLSILLDQINSQACSARPVNHFGNKSWLITICHGVNDSGLFCFSNKKRTCQHVCFHVNHDDVFLMLAALNNHVSS
jgi:hypothetical protein